MQYYLISCLVKTNISDNNPSFLIHEIPSRWPNFVHINKLEITNFPMKINLEAGERTDIVINS